jgi:chromosome segregation ATPase
LELKNTSSTTITSDVQAIWRHLDAIRTTLAAISGAFSTAEDEADARYRGTLVRQQEKLDAVEDERDELKKALSVSERRVQEMEAALAGAIEAHEAEVDALKARIEELEANSKGFDDVMAAIRQELGHKAEA